MDEKIINKLQKQLTSIKFLEDFSNHRWLAFQNYALNWLCSGFYTKAMPFGIVLEIFGNPSTGKSFFVNTTLAEVQKIGGYAILDDVEKRYFPAYGEAAGIDNDKLLYCRSVTVEEHFEQMKSLIEKIRKDDTENPICICLDSLAMLSSNTEQSDRFNKEDMMRKAKKIRQAIRQDFSFYAGNRVLYIMTNHVTNTGNMYGPKTTTPGGTVMPFQSTIRIETKVSEKIFDSRGNCTGVKFTMKTAKSSITTPFKEVTVEIDFVEGLLPYSGLAEVLYKEFKIDRTRKGTKEKKAKYSIDGKEFYEKGIEAIVNKYNLLQDVALPSRPKLIAKKEETNG